MSSVYAGRTYYKVDILKLRLTGIVTRADDTYISWTPHEQLLLFRIANCPETSLPVFCIFTLVLLNPDKPCLQTVQIQISWLLKKPTDLDLHCLPLSMRIYINKPDQEFWLTEN